MAKKSMVNREVKRAKLVKQHASKRAALKAVINDQAKPVEDRFKEARALQELFNMIGTVLPYTGDGLLRPAIGADCWWGHSPEGVFKVVDIPLMRSMPVWGFLEMVAFAKVI